MQTLAEEYPAGVGPPAAIAGRVRVAFLIAQLMMDAMGRNPEDRSAFQRKRCADGHQVLEPLGGLIAAVGEQAVIAHADTYVDGQHVEHGHDRKARPAEEEECGQSPDMK